MSIPLPEDHRRSLASTALQAAQYLWNSLCGSGLLLGALFLAASLTPSLIPRDFLLQGAVAGLSFSAGYGLGVLVRALWNYLELPVLQERHRRIGTAVAAGVATVIVISFIWRAAEWQNSIRFRMEMPPVETTRPIEVLLIAALVFAALLVSAWLFRMVFQWVQAKANHIMPVRVSRIIAIAVTILLSVLLIEGVLFRTYIRIVDRSFQALDALIEPDVSAPADPLGTGSSDSLLDWVSLGRAGRAFISSGPTRTELSDFLGHKALHPIRVYAGLNSAETNENRARLALDELIRVGAFDRSVLVIAVPTGTGRLDPAAINTLEYLHGGDTATVAVQYSYLASPLSLMVEPGYGVAQSRDLFRAVYGYWTTLPKATRPRLYLHGLSLGAFGSEQSYRLHDVLADPFNGALWSGTPFASPEWRSVTRERNQGSPEWLPRFGDGSIIRFTNQENALDTPDAEWGPVRIVYLQYASDPITFFSPESLFRRPDWMNVPVGPDVSLELRWYPVVTFLQLLVDMSVSTSVPIGFGHSFAPAHYIDSWVAVTAPEGWTPNKLDRLKAHLAN